MRYEAVFTVHAPGDGVERRLDHGQAEIEPLVERNCLVRLQGDALEWLAFTLIWLGVDFEAHEPPGVGWLSERPV